MVSTDIELASPSSGFGVPGFSAVHAVQYGASMCPASASSSSRGPPPACRLFPSRAFASTETSLRSPLPRSSQLLRCQEFASGCLAGWPPGQLCITCASMAKHSPFFNATAPHAVLYLFAVSPSAAFPRSNRFGRVLRFHVGRPPSTKYCPFLILSRTNLCLTHISKACLFYTTASPAVRRRHCRPSFLRRRRRRRRRLVGRRSAPFFSFESGRMTDPCQNLSENCQTIRIPP